MPGTLKVRVEDAPAVTDGELKPAVTPPGKPDADRDTDSAVPEVFAVEMVVDPEVP